VLSLAKHIYQDFIGKDDINLPAPIKMALDQWYNSVISVENELGAASTSSSSAPSPTNNNNKDSIFFPLPSEGLIQHSELTSSPSMNTRTVRAMTNDQETLSQLSLIFKEAQFEIFEMLQSDALIRFERTEEFMLIHDTWQNRDIFLDDRTYESYQRDRRGTNSSSRNKSKEKMKGNTFQEQISIFDESVNGPLPPGCKEIKDFESPKIQLVSLTSRQGDPDVVEEDEAGKSENEEEHVSTKGENTTEVAWFVG